MEGYSEAGVPYLEPQGEYYDGVTNCPRSILRSIYLVAISRYEVLPLYLVVDQMLYPSHLGEIKVLPNHTDVGSIHSSR